MYVLNFYTYLGVLFTNTVHLKKCVSDSTSRAKKAVINVMSVSQKVGAFTPNIFFFYIFDAQTLFYSS